MIDKQVTLGGPILLLPAEISTEIFKLAMWVDIYSADSAPQVTPLMLGAVCHSWRVFLWNTPGLWTVLNLKLTGDHCLVQIDLLDRWLQNSRTYSLDIYFDMDSDVVDIPAMGIVALTKLVDQCSRWRRFRTYISKIWTWEFIKVLRRINGRTPLLQSCQLSMGKHFTTVWDMFEEAPLLKRFTMDGLLNIDEIKLPWMQLTSFHWRGVSGRGCFEILSRCSNLIDCDFSYGMSALFGKELEARSRVPISLPYLRSLRITYESGFCVNGILDFILCPELHQLRLSWVSDYPEYSLPIMQIQDFIRRSECVLGVLDVDGVMDISSVLPLLERLPSLQSLALRGVRNVFCGVYSLTWDHNDTDSVLTWDHDDTDSFFNALLMKLDLDSSSVFLPNLTELRCKIPLPLPTCPPLRISHNLLKVLQQRRVPQHGVSKFQKLTVEDTFQLDEMRDGDVIGGLYELIREGMIITIPGL